MALSSVKVIYETVGGQHIIKAVRGGEIPDSVIQAEVNAITGWTGFASIAAAQLTGYTKRNALLGLEYYDDAGTAKVRTVIPSALYKIADRRPILQSNLKKQIEQVNWGMGVHFNKDRTTNTGKWLQKTAAVIMLGVVLSDDSDYAYLLADTQIDAMEWLVKHDTDTWPAQLHSNTEDATPVNTNWYRTNTAGDAWTGLQVTGISVTSDWHTKDLMEELVD